MHEYQLIRSKRRTLALEVTPEGRVIARAPKGLPKAEIDRFVAGKAEWLRKHLARRRPKPREIGPLEEAALREKAGAILPGLVTRYAAQLKVQPRYVTITGAQKRFGSCNMKGGLCFSWRLMRYPLPAIEYVAAHEVAHLKQLNHSAAFYQVLLALMPDYKVRAALLKQPPD
ncbi:MAG: DUF45 domain-containing protein [Eubacteriales bacterium]|nr:DUF45 domain-containing protein [Eubacteriales bacterium]